MPGAKPLSVNEVRLTKDEDDEREHRKSRSDSTSDHKPRRDSVSKSESKQSEAKMDNHIGNVLTLFYNNCMHG